MKSYIKENIEISIEQICLASSKPFGEMKIWVGRVREPTITVSKDCTNQPDISQTIPSELTLHKRLSLREA